jgi:hypothetical protein
MPEIRIPNLVLAYQLKSRQKIPGTSEKKTKKTAINATTAAQEVNV